MRNVCDGNVELFLTCVYNTNQMGKVGLTLSVLQFFHSFTCVCVFLFSRRHSMYVIWSLKEEMEEALAWIYLFYLHDVGR